MFATVRKSLMKIQLVGTFDTYAITELLGFLSKIEKQVIRGRIRLYVNPYDVVLTGYFPIAEILIPIIPLLNVFIAEKFVVASKLFFIRISNNRT